MIFVEIKKHPIIHVKTSHCLFIGLDESKRSTTFTWPRFYLATLQKNKIETVPLSRSVVDPNFQVDEVLEDIWKHGNDEDSHVALGAFVWNEQFVQDITKRLKERQFKGKILLGGPQISYAGKGLEKYYPFVDRFVRGKRIIFPIYFEYLVIGYGEEAILKFAQGTENFIKGLHVSGAQDLQLQAQTDFVQLPSPYLEGIIKPQPFLRWETQRGCPFQCSFCQHKESDLHMKRREMARERIMKEIDFFVKNKVDDLAVLDPTFNSGPHYLDIMKRFIELKNEGKISLQTRFEMVKPEFLQLCDQLNKTGKCIFKQEKSNKNSFKGKVTLEFGLQTIHPQEWKVIQRPNQMKRVSEVIEELNSKKISYEVSLIYGLPHQTLQSFKESVEWCRSKNIPGQSDF